MNKFCLPNRITHERYLIRDEKLVFSSYNRLFVKQIMAVTPEYLINRIEEMQKEDLRANQSIEINKKILRNLQQEASEGSTGIPTSSECAQKELSAQRAEAEIRDIAELKNDLHRDGNSLSDSYAHLMKMFKQLHHMRSSIKILQEDSCIVSDCPLELSTEQELLDEIAVATAHLQELKLRNLQYKTIAASPKRGPVPCEAIADDWNRVIAAQNQLDEMAAELRKAHSRRVVN